MTEINKVFDSTKLHQLLSTQQWKAADLETRRIMLQVTGADHNDDLLMSKAQILQFPCDELETIDKLWVKFSQKRFGFSIVKQIYSAANQDYSTLAELVGWRNGDKWINYQEINFSIHAPVGHLPLTWLVPSTFGMYWLARFSSPGWRSILQRVGECNL